MSYEKVWANNEKLNQTEKNKLKKMDWKSLMIFLTMQKMASNLFRKKSGTHSNGQGCIYNVPKKLVIL